VARSVLTSGFTGLAEAVNLSHATSSTTITAAADSFAEPRPCWEEDASFFGSAAPND